MRSAGDCSIDPGDVLRPGKYRVARKGGKIKLHDLIRMKWRTSAMLILTAIVGVPVLVYTLVWLEDQYSNGSLYALCDDLPIANLEYTPLRNQIFTSGCYIESACHAGEYNVSMELSIYEVQTLAHCGRERVLRPDRAFVRAIQNLNYKPEPMRIPTHTEPETLEVAEVES